MGGFPSKGMVAGINEHLQARMKLFVELGTVTFNYGGLAGAAHPLDLPVDRRMVGFGEATTDTMRVADTIKHEELYVIREQHS